MAGFPGTDALEIIDLRVRELRWRFRNGKGLASHIDLRALRVWWRFRDSNPGPADYDSVALTG